MQTERSSCEFPHFLGYSDFWFLDLEKAGLGKGLYLTRFKMFDWGCDDSASSQRGTSTEDANARVFRATPSFDFSILRRLVWERAFLFDVVLKF